MFSACLHKGPINRNIFNVYTELDRCAGDDWKARAINASTAEGDDTFYTTPLKQNGVLQIRVRGGMMGLVAACPGQPKGLMINAKHGVDVFLCDITQQVLVNEKFTPESFNTMEINHTIRWKLSDLHPPTIAEILKTDEVHLPDRTTLYVSVNGPLDRETLTVSGEVTLKIVRRCHVRQTLALGMHPRVGAECPLCALEPAIVAMIADMCSK
jgi:hypothetical protein